MKLLAMLVDFPMENMVSMFMNLVIFKMDVVVLEVTIIHLERIMEHQQMRIDMLETLETSTLLIIWLW